MCEAQALVRAAADAMAEFADPEAAPAMAAYMKTDMPFYGVKKPDRVKVLRELIERFPPSDQDRYHDNVSTLWEQPHREEKYLAIAYARGFPEFVSFEQIRLYERMIVEGAWWDLVDEIAAHLVGRVLLRERVRTAPVVEEWIDSDRMWLRRTAILSQLRHKEQTDASMLFDFCRRRAHETEFFIRKAIGWALRQYSRIEPEAVTQFVDAEWENLSPLSRREATRHLA